MAASSQEKAAYACALASYPVQHLPHRGEPAALGAARRAENFAFFREIMPERIACVRDVFTEIAPAIDQLLDPARPVEPAISAIEAWWIPRLPMVDLLPRLPKRSPLARLTGWRDDRYHNPTLRLSLNPSWHRAQDDPALDRLLNFLADLGTVFGEAAVRRHPDFSWAVNEDPGDRRRKLPEWGQIVVLRPPMGNWVATSLDFIAEMRLAYQLGVQQAGAKREWPPAPTRPVQGLYVSWFGGWKLANLVNGKMEPR